MQAKPFEKYKLTHLQLSIKNIQCKFIILFFNKYYHLYPFNYVQTHKNAHSKKLKKKTKYFFEITKSTAKNIFFTYVKIINEYFNLYSIKRFYI